MNSLRIYFSSSWRDSSSSCAWAICNEQGTVLDSGNSPLGAMPKHAHYVGIVAAERVLNIRVKAPAGSRRRWMTALPFVAEEYTLPDPEDNHVVPGHVHADGQMTLSIIDKAWLKRILEACDTAKISLRKLLPETFLAPLAPHAWTVVWNGNQGFVRTAPEYGLSLDCPEDGNSAPLALRLQLNANDKPQHIVLYPTAQVSQENMPDWDDIDVPIRIGETWDWRRVPLSSDGINLLWGEFAPRTRVAEWLPYVRPALWIMFAAALVEIVGVNAQWLKLAQEKKQLTQEMNKSFQQAFGDVEIVNPPLQMQRNLAELRHRTGVADKTDYLSLLDSVSPALAALPAGSIQSLQYDSGKLDIQLKLAQREMLIPVRNKLEAQLPAKGLKLTTDEGRESNNMTEIKLSVLARDG